MALFLSIFPIVLLIWLMVKKNSMPSYVRQRQAWFPH